MNEENLEQRAQRLERENEMLRAENEKLRAEKVKGRKMLTSNEIGPVIMISPARNTLGPTTNDPHSGPGLLQAHGLKIKSPEERSAELLEKVKQKRQGKEEKK